MNQALTVTIVIAVAGIAFYLWKRPSERAPKTSMLKSVTTDLTALAREGKLDPVRGRAGEIDRVINILVRRTKNNPLLVGSAGVGKTAIAEGLAQRIIESKVPDRLKGRRLLSLDLPGLIGGTKYRGELEQRMTALTDEIEKAAGSIILFIDELHIIQQTRGSEGAIAVGDILKPLLARGELPVIGATTPKEYKEFIEPDEAMARRFQTVLVPEPTPEDAVAMIQGLRTKYEEFHGVKIADDIIEAAVRLSAKHIGDRKLPDKAIDVIDEAAAKVHIAGDNPHRHIAGIVFAAARKRASMGKPKVVHVADLREVIAEWTNKQVKEIK